MGVMMSRRRPQKRQAAPAQPKPDMGGQCDQGSESYEAKSKKKGK